jgi:ubiquinone biosynthesis monooxygenase Coq7
MFLSPLDQLITRFDHSLRVVAGVVDSKRESPATSISDNQDLSPEQRREAAALMRVNHAGEVCAQALYQGQALASDDQVLKEKLARAAEEELDHMAWTRDRVVELGGTTSVLNPLWYAGSFAIGFAAGKLGDKVNLGFLAETERQVERHLNGHLARLSPEDLRTRAIVETMAVEEAAHADMARKLGAVHLPAPIRQAMTFASRVMTTLTYRF